MTTANKIKLHKGKKPTGDNWTKLGFLTDGESIFIAYGERAPAKPSKRLIKLIAEGKERKGNYWLEFGMAKQELYKTPAMMLLKVHRPHLYAKVIILARKLYALS